MKYKPPHLAAIFFLAYFYRLDPLLLSVGNSGSRGLFRAEAVILHSVKSPRLEIFALFENVVIVFFFEYSRKFYFLSFFEKNSTN